MFEEVPGSLRNVLNYECLKCLKTNVSNFKAFEAFKTFEYIFITK